MVTRTMPQPVGRTAAAAVFGVIALALAGCAATPATPSDPLRLRYYGGPKQPMYPEQSPYPRQLGYPE